MTAKIIVLLALMTLCLGCIMTEPPQMGNNSPPAGHGAPPTDNGNQLQPPANLPPTTHPPSGDDDGTLPLSPPPVEIPPSDVPPATQPPAAQPPSDNQNAPPAPTNNNTPAPVEGGSFTVNYVYTHDTDLYKSTLSFTANGQFHAAGSEYPGEYVFKAGSMNWQYLDTFDSGKEGEPCATRTVKQARGIIDLNYDTPYEDGTTYYEHYHEGNGLLVYPNGQYLFGVNSQYRDHVLSNGKLQRLISDDCLDVIWSGNGYVSLEKGTPCPPINYPVSVTETRIGPDTLTDNGNIIPCPKLQTAHHEVPPLMLINEMGTLSGKAGSGSKSIPVDENTKTVYSWSFTLPL